MAAGFFEPTRGHVTPLADGRARQYGLPSRPAASLPYRGGRTECETAVGLGLNRDR